jgi:futalosine hydrolase
MPLLIMNLLIVAAMEQELDLLIEACRPESGGYVAGYRHYSGTMGKHAIRIGITGVGIASASMALGAFCATETPEAAIMVGSAGMFPGFGLCVGDLVVAQTEILSELGVVSGPGIGDGDLLKLSGVDQEISLDGALSGQIVKAGQEVAKVAFGKSLTVTGASANMDHAVLRVKQFGALAENMEGYALALAGQRFGIPVAEIRGISNETGDRNRLNWDFKTAMALPQKAVLEFLG